MADTSTEKAKVAADQAADQTAAAVVEEGSSTKETEKAATAAAADAARSAAPELSDIRTPRNNAEDTIIGCAVIVLAVWGFRTLYESGKEVKGSESSSVKELAGLSAHPAKPAQFLLGYGFVFFVLSVVGIGAPDFAKMFAILIATGTTLANGAMMFTDIGNAEAEATNTKGQSTTSLVTKNPVKVGENQTVRSKA